MDEIAVVAYEEYAQREKHKSQLAVCGKALKVEGRAELMPEAAVLDGLERGRILEQEKRRYADENGDGVYGDANDYMFTGTSMTPKFYYGFQVELGWKGIDF